MRFRNVFKIVTASALVFLAVSALADDARRILEESEARHRTSSMAYSGELVVVSKEGKTRAKSWKSYREGFGGDAKVLVRFTMPPEVRGVGFLSLGKEGRNADQWLYLPSMKRERRIASQDRDTSFVGTDFSYEDMEEFDHKKYDVKLRGEKTVDGRPCHVIEASPSAKSGRSAYAKRVLYIDKEILYLVREELFREGDESTSKLFTLSDLEKVEGVFVARNLEMSDLKKGSKTTVRLKEITVNKPNPADRFTIVNLNREGGD